MLHDAIGYCIQCMQSLKPSPILSHLKKTVPIGNSMASSWVERKEVGGGGGGSWDRSFPMHSPLDEPLVSIPDAAVTSVRSLLCMHGACK
jgi:hypothetical protein